MKEKFNLKPSRTADELELAHKKAQNRALNPEYIKRNSGAMRWLKDMIQAFTIKPFNEHRLSHADRINDMYLQKYNEEIYRDTLNRLNSSTKKEKDLTTDNTRSEISESFEKTKQTITSGMKLDDNPEIVKATNLMLETLEELKKKKLAELDSENLKK